MKRLRDNPASTVVMAVVVVALIYIGLTVRSANDTAGKNAAATGQLAEVLNRRSPILEYLSCSDQRAIAVDTAEKNFLLALVDKAPEVPLLRSIYEDAVKNRAKTNNAEADGGCGDIPTGG